MTEKMEQDITQLKQQYEELQRELCFLKTELCTMKYYMFESKSILNPPTTGKNEVIAALSGKNNESASLQKNVQDIEEDAIDDAQAKIQEIESQKLSQDGIARKKSLSLTLISNLDNTSSEQTDSAKTPEFSNEDSRNLQRYHQRSSSLYSSMSMRNNTGVWSRLFGSGRFNLKDAHAIAPTMHMYTIYTLNKRHWSYSCIFVMLSFFIVAMQIIVLQYIMYEVWHPSCSSHTDCPVGQYCTVGEDEWLSQMDMAPPRCSDCWNKAVDEWSFNRTSQVLFIKDKNETRVIECGPIIAQVPEWDYEGLDHKYVSFSNYMMTTMEQEDMSDCLSFLYCDSTDILQDTCDHYVLNKKRLTPGFILSLVFLSAMGLTPTLIQEVEEAMIDEMILEETCIKRTVLLNWHLCKSLAGQLMYVVLRLRCYTIPFLAAIATASIIIGESYLVQSVLLNILSIAFVLEIDNLTMTLILPPGECVKLKEFISEKKRVYRQNSNISLLEWTWSRMISVTGVALMIYSILHPTFDDCSTLYGPKVIFVLYSASAYYLGHCVGVCFFKRSIMDFSLDLFRNAFALTFTLLSLLMFPHGEGFNTEVIIAAIVTSGLALMLVLLYIVKRLCT